MDNNDILLTMIKVIKFDEKELRKEWRRRRLKREWRRRRRRKSVDLMV